MLWGGEDWSFQEEGEDDILLGDHQNKNRGGFVNSTSSSSSEPATEVKIKITKKQLQELLGRVDVKQLSVQQVVAHLITVSDGFEAQDRSWRPNLQSIPE
ncbi:hypothetical protein LINGRAHAP2_LOCUS21176 [Linum grandiflorum]